MPRQEFVCQNENFAGKFFENLAALKDEGTFTDIEVVIKDERIPLHKIVLCSSSDYFQNISMNEDTSEVVIDSSDVTVSTFYMISDYLYTGSLKASRRSLSELLRAARYLQVDFVKEWCEDTLEELQRRPRMARGSSLPVTSSPTTGRRKVSEGNIAIVTGQPRTANISENNSRSQIEKSLSSESSPSPPIAKKPVVKNKPKTPWLFKKGAAVPEHDSLPTMVAPVPPITQRSNESSESNKPKSKAKPNFSIEDTVSKLLSSGSANRNEIDQKQKNNQPNEESTVKQEGPIYLDVIESDPEDSPGNDDSSQHPEEVPPIPPRDKPRKTAPPARPLPQPGLRNPRRSKSAFPEEPLYQLYDCFLTAKRMLKETGEKYVEPDYVAVREKEAHKKILSLTEEVQRPGTDRASQDYVYNLRSIISKAGAYIQEWKMHREVKKRRLNNSLSEDEQAVQEILFELVTSTVSYHKSLVVLKDVFYDAPAFTIARFGRLQGLSKKEKEDIFSKLIEIHESTERLVKQLENIWTDNCQLSVNVIESIEKNIDHLKQEYIEYISSVSMQEDALQNLRKQEMFDRDIKKLEKDERCEMLVLNTFLAMPERRLHCLLDVIQRLKVANIAENDTGKVEKLEKSLEMILESGVKAANLRTTKEIYDTVVFKDVKKFSMVSSERHLTKRLELNRILTDDKNRKDNCLFYIFNDYLLITKKKKVPTATLR